MKPKAIIFDVDGTVALRGARGPYDMTRVSEDTPNKPVMAVAKMLGAAGQAAIIFVTGRDGSAAQATGDWLEEHYGKDFFLFTRATGDNRDDAQVKQDILDLIRGSWDIIAVFDDRNRVVDMWRRNDITCFQVCSREQGDF